MRAARVTLILGVWLLPLVACTPVSLQDCSENEIRSCGGPIMAKFNQYTDERSLCCLTLSLGPCYRNLSPKCLTAMASLIHNIPQYAGVNSADQFEVKYQEELNYCSRYQQNCR